MSPDLKCKTERSPNKFKTHPSQVSASCQADSSMTRTRTDQSPTSLGIPHCFRGVPAQVLSYPLQYEGSTTRTARKEEKDAPDQSPTRHFPRAAHNKVDPPPYGRYSQMRSISRSLHELNDFSDPSQEAHSAVLSE